MNTIQILPAIYFKTGFENNLTLVGVEDRLPQWMGNSTDFQNFDDELNLLGL